jgi:hypothetical protein
MRISILLVFFLFVSCASKKELNTNEPYIYKIETENGNIKQIPMFQRGQLNTNDLNEIVHYLSPANIFVTQPIIINYIDNDPFRQTKANYQVPWDIFYGNLKQDLSSIYNCNQIWMHNPRVKNLYYYHKDSRQWYKDVNLQIRDLFFANEGLNGGFVIIQPNGKYYLRVGEYSKKDILEIYSAEIKASLN